MPKIGEVIDCPQCHGTKKDGKGKCRVCDGYGRIEYQESQGDLRAPAGSWLAANYNGKSNFRVVLFGGPKMERTR